MYICNKKKQIGVEVYVCEYKKDQQLFILKSATIIQYTIKGRFMSR